MTTAPRSSAHPNSLGADVLRGIAILMVVAYHALGPVWGWYVPWSGWFRDFGAAPSRAILWAYPLTFGWAGVSLFFVISGFCIHTSFLRSQSFEPGQFFWRRLWRLYPAYLAALAVLAIAAHLDRQPGGSIAQVATHAVFAHNVTYDLFFGINGSFWSIAVEVQLYLLFPLLLWLRARFGLPKAIAVTFGVGCAWRLAVMSLWPAPEHLISPAWTSPLMTWFDWSLGAFVAERYASGRRAFARPAAWLAALVPLLVVSTLVKPLTALSFTLASAASAVLLDVALRATWRPTWTVRALAFVGTISYSLYLWHQPLLAPLLTAVTTLTGSTAAAWIALPPAIIVFSWLSYVVLEQPGIALGHALWRLLKARNSATSATASLTLPLAPADFSATQPATRRSAA